MTDDDYWDCFLDREYSRAAGEFGWWGVGLGEQAQPRPKSQVQLLTEARKAQKERERAAGPPPDRDSALYGPRGNARGDRRFRKDRETWYERFTGQSIKDASLQRQNELCDAVRRRFRAYNDGRT